MKKMMMCVFVFVFAFFNTMAYEQFGEADKNFASWKAGRLLADGQYKEAAACAAICKDIEQAELIRKQKKLVEVQIELAAEQKKLVKAQTALLDFQVRELLKSLRSLVDETEMRVRNKWMR